MTNAEKFKKVFGVYATEIWAMQEDEYLDWSSSDYIKVVDRFYDGEDVEPIAERLAKARAEGSEEAWTFRNMITYSHSSKEGEWYKQNTKSCCEMTYAEAKVDFERWKAEHEWEPKVGDVVTCFGEQGVLLQIIGDSAYVMWKNEGCGYCELKNMSPTGEHVDISPIFEVLK